MDIQEELDGVLHWIAALLILLLQWLYPRVPWSHALSRMFYDHLTLSRDLTYCLYPIYILTPLYACRVLDSVFKCVGNLFLFWALITTIMYLRAVCLRINLRLNNIFCYCLNFAFLSLLIIKSSTYKSVSGHLWYWLYMKVTSDCNDYWSMVEKIIKVKMSKVQDKWCSRCRIEFWYSDLAWDNLITLITLQV